MQRVDWELKPGRRLVSQKQAWHLARKLVRRQMFLEPKAVQRQVLLLELKAVQRRMCLLVLKAGRKLNHLDP